MNMVFIIMIVISGIGGLLAWAFSKDNKNVDLTDKEKYNEELKALVVRFRKEMVNTREERIEREKNRVFPIASCVGERPFLFGHMSKENYELYKRLSE